MVRGELSYCPHFVLKGLVMLIWRDQCFWGEQGMHFSPNAHPQPPEPLAEFKLGRA